MYIDFETYSDVDIRKVGGYQYSVHLSTKVILMGYSPDRSSTVKVTDNTDEIIELLKNATMIYAFNVAFERDIIENVLKLSLNIPYVCIKSMGHSLGIAGGLNVQCEFMELGTTERKDKANGTRLINHFCKDGLKEHSGEKWEQFIHYCKQDVVAMIALMTKYIVIVDDYNRRYFMKEYNSIDRINRNGMPLDIPLIELINTNIDIYKEYIKSELDKKIGGSTPTKLKEYYSGIGIELENTKKDYLSTIDTQKEIIDMYLSYKSTSVVKYKRLKEYDTNNIKHCLAYNGASSTGRLSGRMFQPQNLPKGYGIKTESIIKEIKESGKMKGNVIEVAKNLIRGVIKAPEGKYIAVVDLSSIESVLCGYYTNCKPIIETFAKGKDIYKVVASRLFKIDYEEVTKEQRTLAKPVALGGQYQLGAMGLKAYAENYGVILTEKEALNQTRVFRSDFKEIVKCWYFLDNFIKDILRQDQYGKFNLSNKYKGLSIHRTSKYTRVALPSGRFIYYHGLRLDDNNMTYRAVEHNRVVRLKLYGGKIFQNIIQGLGRDILQNIIYNLEQYEVINIVHDEVVVVVDNPSVLMDIKKIMDIPPLWYPELNINNDGFITTHYRKD